MLHLQSYLRFWLSIDGMKQGKSSIFKNKNHQKIAQKGTKTTIVKKNRLAFSLINLYEKFFMSA
jgi:hypothetical protein